MDRKDRHKREAPVSYRPPEKLRAEFHARAADSGLPTNAFITKAVFGLAAPPARRAAPLDQQTSGLLVARSAQILDRLKQALPPDASPELVAVFEDCRGELTEIRTCLMLALGREP